MPAQGSPPGRGKGRRDVAPPSSSAARARPRPAAQPGYRAEALAEGLRVLSVSRRAPTWRITGIAAEVALPLLTGYQVVMTLLSEAYLDHLHSGEYLPGYRS